MAELTAFTPTTKDEFAQLTRDRKAEFDLLRANGRAIHAVHHETIWRYKASDQQHQVVSDNMNEWLFHPQYGVMTWLGL